MIQIDRIPIHPAGDSNSDWAGPFRVRVTDKVKPLDFLFSYPDGQGLIAQGNLVTFKGAPKSGKSAFGLALMTAALKGDFLGLKAARPGLSVLWIDTEQATPVLIEKIKAVLTMVGLSTDAQPEQLQVYSVLLCRDTRERQEVVYRLIREIRPDVTLIDGVAELCEDFNDSAEGKKVPDELMRLAEECGTAIIGVIHTNKNDDHARGHLGAAMQKNAAQTYLVSNNGGVASAVQVEGRFGPRPNVTFTFTDGFRLKSADSLLQSLKAAKTKELISDFSSIFKDAKADKLSKDDLRGRYKLARGCQNRTAEEAIKTAVEAFVLAKTPRIKGKVYYSFIAQEIVQDEAEDDTCNL